MKVFLVFDNYGISVPTFCGVCFSTRALAKTWIHNTIEDAQQLAAQHKYVPYENNRFNDFEIRAVYVEGISSDSH